MQPRQSLYVGISSISTVLLMSIVLHDTSLTTSLYSDVTQSFWGRDWVQAGTLPYISSAFEYPPVSGLLLYSVKAIGSTFQGYYATFSGLSLMAGVVVAWACYRITRLSGRELSPFYFLLPSFLIYGIYNFDLFHAMFVMLSLLSLLSKRRGLSALFLGLAVSTKLASAVLFPLFLLEIRNPAGKEYISEPAPLRNAFSWIRTFFNRARLTYLAIFILVVAIINLPFAVLNLQNFLAGYQFIGNWGLEDAWYVWIFQDPSTWGYAKIFGLLLAAVLLLRVYTLKADILTKTFLALAAYLMGTYIYSPQFNLLLLPLIAVLEVQSPALFLWDGFNSLIILTWFIPNTSPTLPGTWPQYFSLLRALSLVMLSLSIAAGAGLSRDSIMPRRLLRWGGEVAARLRPQKPSPPQ